MGDRRHKSIGGTSSVTPFKAHVNKFQTLNATADNMQMSKRSLVSVNRTIGGNESMGSIRASGDQKRAVSLSIRALKDREVQDVKKGYRSNLLFEHTIADIIRVLEHKLGKSAA